MAKTHTKATTQNRKARREREHGSIPPSSTGNSNRHSTKLIILSFLLSAATLALYSPVLGYSFIVLDDHDYVTANPHVHGGLSWSTIRWAFTSTEAANWHPLTWLSHAFDYQLFALNPIGHHLDGVLLHSLNAVVLFLLLSWATKRMGPSLLVAALFAVHPLNVESVVWVSERKNVLSTLFFLLAIAAYARYARKPDWRRYLLVAGLFAAGLMAKPMVITLPFVFLLLDYWPLNRMTLETPPDTVALKNAPAAEAIRSESFSRLFIEKVPLLLLSAASAWITIKVQHAGMAVRSLHQFPLGIRIENAIVSYGLYLWKMVWPAHLSLYPYSPIALPAWQWILSALVLICVTALVVMFRGKRYLPVGWFWFLGTLVPVIGLVQVGDASMADRYAYIPLIGVFVMISFGLADLAQARAIGVTWRVIPALCALIALSFVTHRQMSYWQSDYDLWARTLAIAENPVSHDAMGSALLDPGLHITAENEADLDTPEKRLAEARRHFERALYLRRQLEPLNPAATLPDIAATLNNLGNLDRLENRMDDARQQYEAALNIHRQLLQQKLEPFPPDLATTLNNLGALEQSTKVDDARRYFEEALTVYRDMATKHPDQFLPKVAQTLNSLGYVERASNRFDESRRCYEEALKIRRQLAQEDENTYLPYLAMTLNDLAILDAAQYRADDASRHYQEALQSYRQLARQDPETYTRYVAATLNNLAFLDEQQGRIEPARASYQEALDLYRQLMQNDSETYAADVARLETSLQHLNKEHLNK
ncbi:MAG: tetratricopeptide repeat protein [Terriglobales bacterium]|jgi:tetratricopeptide (TPR) repeat protein